MLVLVLLGVETAVQITALLRSRDCLVMTDVLVKGVSLLYLLVFLDEVLIEVEVVHESVKDALLRDTDLWVDLDVLAKVREILLGFDTEIRLHLRGDTLHDDSALLLVKLGDQQVYVQDFPREDTPLRLVLDGDVGLPIRVLSVVVVRDGDDAGERVDPEFRGIVEVSVDEDEDQVEDEDSEGVRHDPGRPVEPQVDVRDEDSESEPDVDLHLVLAKIVFQEEGYL